MKNRLILLLILCTGILIHMSMYQAYSQNTDIAEINALLDKSERLRSINTDEALVCATTAEQLAIELEDINLLARANYELGIIHCIVGKYSEANLEFNESLKYYTDIDDLQGMSQVYNALGQLNRFTSDYAESLKNLTKAINIKEELGNELSLAISLNNLGLTYIELYDFGAAMEYCQKSFDIASELKDTSEIVNSGNGLAIIHSKMNNVDLALDYYYQILKLIKSDNYYKKSEVYNNIANIYLKSEEYATARDYFSRCLKLSNETHDSYSQAVALLNLGNVELRLTNYTKAKDYFNKSKDISTEIDDNIGKADALFGLGLIAMEKNQSTKAIKTLSNSLEIYKNKNINDKIAEVSKVMSEIHAKAGSFAEAFNYQEQYTAINEEITKNENAGLVSAISTKLQAEKDIEIYQKENELYKARFENTLIIMISIVALLVLFSIFFFTSMSLRKKLGMSNYLLDEKKKLQKLVYTKLSEEINLILFEISVMIAGITNKETFHQFSFAYEKLSKKYNELLEEVRIENE
jgi:adenylate cyclase